MFNGKVIVTLVTEIEVESKTPEVPKTTFLTKVSITHSALIRWTLLRKFSFELLKSLSAKMRSKVNNKTLTAQL